MPFPVIIWTQNEEKMLFEVKIPGQGYVFNPGKKQYHIAYFQNTVDFSIEGAFEKGCQNVL